MPDKPDPHDGFDPIELPEIIDDFLLEPLQAFNGDMGCCGRFCADAAICRDRCALRLRCSIEREQCMRMEIMEDLMSMGMMGARFQ